MSTLADVAERLPFPGTYRVVRQSSGEPDCRWRTGAHLESGGTVKWYKPEKGFGFIAPDNGEKDVFVHASTLARSGLSVLVEGQKVVVECGQGKKGLEVRSIRLA